MIDTNPLLTLADSDRLPDFQAIKPEHFMPAIEQLIADCRSETDRLAAESRPASWNNFLYPLESCNDRLEQAWNCINHIEAVANNDEVRKAYADCRVLVTEYGTWAGQHEALYGRCSELRDSDAYQQFDLAQQRALDNLLREFKLAGVALEPEAKQRYAAIKARLSELSTTFSNNVLDATEAFEKIILDEKELEGLPERVLEMARQKAEEKNSDGFLLTLDIPSYLPVMQYCHNRELRAELYRAYTTRASEEDVSRPEFDNSACIEETLTLKQELALLLGFANYAELSMARKMASSSDDVMEFLENLAAKSHPLAGKEYEQLQRYATDEMGFDEVQASDLMYVTEALRKERYDLSQEILRPYFPAGKVLQGMFAVVEKLYGITIVAAEAPSLWHSDAALFAIERNGETIARFYLDIYAREGKRGGAWMADCRGRRIGPDGRSQKPVAFLNCNFTPPGNDTPSLLTHGDVTTLFHEFGHGLHHMLTSIECAAVAGINGVAWDAVELPSQFMENWCWEPEVLNDFAQHYETGEPLPAELLEKMIAAKNFQSAMQMVRQLEFGLFDLCIHREYGRDGWRGVQETLDEVRGAVAVSVPPAFNRFQNSFSHIFAGGYAAGYYSYKWAEVLSADAYSLFEENGIFDRDTGMKFYEEVLSRGGSEEPAVLFKRFRGREPRVDALLRHSGITAADAA